MDQLITACAKIGAAAPGESFAQVFIIYTGISKFQRETLATRRYAAQRAHLCKAEAENVPKRERERKERRRTTLLKKQKIQKEEFLK